MSHNPRVFLRYLGNPSCRGRRIHVDLWRIHVMLFVDVAEPMWLRRVWTCSATTRTRPSSREAVLPVRKPMRWQPKPAWSTATSIQSATSCWTTRPTWTTIWSGHEHKLAASTDISQGTRIFRTKNADKEHDFVSSMAGAVEAYYDARSSKCLEVHVEAGWTHDL